MNLRVLEPCETAEKRYEIDNIPLVFRLRVISMHCVWYDLKNSP